MCVSSGSEVRGVAYSGFLFAAHNLCVGGWVVFATLIPKCFGHVFNCVSLVLKNGNLSLRH